MRARVVIARAASPMANRRLYPGADDASVAVECTSTDEYIYTSGVTSHGHDELNNECALQDIIVRCRLPMDVSEPVLVFCF